MTAMEQLREYVMVQAVRGACQCGKCADAPANPEQKQPVGHTADMIFFKVAAQPTAKADELKRLVQASQQGSFCNVDLFDGKEHNYLELGGWIGDQGLALMLMGLGTVLGLWRLLSPVTMLNFKSDDPMTMQMAGMGFLAVQVKDVVVTPQEPSNAVPG